MASFADTLRLHPRRWAPITLVALFVAWSFRSWILAAFLLVIVFMAMLRAHRRRHTMLAHSAAVMTISFTAGSLLRGARLHRRARLALR